MTKIAQIQTILGVTADGVWGAKSQAALEEAKAERPIRQLPDPTSNGEGAVDERSARNIATLLPPVRPIAVKLLALLKDSGITAKVISGTRSYVEQDELYAQGRTKGGRVVTKARGGYSNHNFGVAFDIGIFENGKYLDESQLYRKAGAIGKQIGLDWGGDWHFSDEPHFEWRPAWAKDLSENDALAAYRGHVSRGDPIA